jgi:catechol 2,3-dioxygenase-like lactoylglutathione lyase family enzyme
MTAPAVRSVRHAGIVVEDMERCLIFYRDVLGLTVKAAADETGPFIDTLLGVPNVTVRTAKLGAPEGQALLELLEFKSPLADAKRTVSVKTPGPTHVALTVRDLDALAPKVTAAGGEMIGPPRVSPDGKVKAAYVRDVEGNLLELVEEL